MNKFYIIVPVIMLAVFGFFYSGAVKEMKAKEVAKEQKAAEVKAVEAKRKAEIEAKATAEARKRQEEREAEEAAKSKKREDEYKGVMKTLLDETSTYTTEADKLAKEAAELENKISQSRSDREKLNREALEIAKQVELAKINRRNAELEIQRMVDMVAKKTGATGLANPPALPALPTK